MKVLFAVDGSDSSLASVAEVGPLLDPTRDEVAFFSTPPSKLLATGTANADVLNRARLGFAEAIFDEARRRLPGAWQTRVQTFVDEQHDPRQGIIQASEKWQADLIVVGARGLGTVKRLLVGSVSRSVVHASQVPVWIGRAETASPATGQGVRVLLTCEHPDKGCRQSEVLGKFTWPPGSVCHAVTAVPSLFAGKVPEWLQQQARSPEVEAMVQDWAREHAEELATSRRNLEQLVAGLPPVFERYEINVCEGEPAGVIFSEISKHQANVVVLGTNRKSWLSSTLLGSTSEAVLNHAPCSVLVVPLISES
jgi:nucleotide-binding universal stress UspA family protein